MKLDWPDIANQLDIEGYALLPGLLTRQQSLDLVSQLDTPALSRASLASSGFGRGELCYLREPLPVPLPAWRTELYRHLAPIANRWNDVLDIAYRYPTELSAFLRHNRAARHTGTLSHMNRLGQADFLALHQHNQGEHVFPLQIVALLSDPGRDFEGGEFVMTEQRPRMQSRPMVLPLGLGDLAIISTAQRPLKGSKGYYRVNLKHAISRVRRGMRVGLELFFDNAP